MDGLTDSQAKAWELLHGENSVFLTGEAGSGKSFLIKRLTGLQDPKVFPVLASTGAAAVLIGGRTLHSFLGLGILEGGPERAVAKALSDKRVVRRVKRAKGLIIDEISMISGQTLAAAERVCRLAREEEIPWGGLQIVVVGDFAQLPPVERARQGMPDWAFKSRTWLESEFQPALLEQNLRTGNADFLRVLNSVRRGEISGLVRDFAQDRKRELPADFAGTVLFPRRQQAEEHNDRKLGNLRGTVRQFPSIFGGESRYIEALKRYSPLPDELRLKVGALVMLRQNDPRGRWVNGSTGVLEGFGEDSLIVQLLSGRRIELEMSTFSLLDAEGKVRASVTNYPVILAWATTIHKSQGMTLDRLAVDLGQLWEPGQAYVALSRITEPENLWLTRWQESSVRADPMVTRFYQEMGAK